MISIINQNNRSVFLTIWRIFLLCLLVVSISTPLNPILAAVSSEARLSPAQLTTDITFSQTEAAPGATIELTIDIANQGMQTAENIEVSISLDDELIFFGESIATGESNTQQLEAIASLANETSQSLSYDIVIDEKATDYQLVSVLVKNADGIVETAAYERIHVLESSNTILGESSVSGEAGEPAGWLFRPIEPVPSLFAGSLNYSVPLEAPPARGGVGPGLALSYSSRTVDGTTAWHDSNKYGEGWSLSGVPFIARNGAKYCDWDGSDQYFICFEPGFTLFMGGSSPLDYVGSCGTNCDHYEAADQPGLYVKYHRAGANNTLGEYWEVRSPDGNIYRFGYEEDAEQVLVRACLTAFPNCEDQVTYRWYLDQAQDPFSNFMALEYRDKEAAGDNSGSFWACDGAVCRELDVWPTKILYNNNVTSPSRDIEGHWESKIILGWYERNKSDVNGWPIFLTEAYLSSVYMYQREAGALSEMWHYNVQINEYPCYDAPPYTNVCGNDSRLRTLDSIQRIESGGQAWPATTFSYFGEQGGEPGFNEAKITGELWYVGGSCPFGCWVKVRYPHLKLIRNGYGGVYEFTYDELGMHDHTKSWYITDMKVWDGLINNYDQSDHPTYHTTYTDYNEPCYDDWGACTEGPGEPSHKLIGFRNVTVNVYDYPDGAPNFLARTDYDFLVHSNNGGHPRLWGRENFHVQYANEVGTQKVSETIMGWRLNDPGSDCPRVGFNADYVCLYSVTNKFYEYTGGNALFSHATRELYQYNPNLQYDTGASSARQWGLRTFTTHQYYDGTNYAPLSRNLTAYVTNENQNHWVAMRRTNSTFALNWTPLHITLSLYGNSVDPDDQVISRGDQVKWVRAIVNRELLPNGTETTWDTVDTYYTYGNYGNMISTKTFDGYGQQNLRVGEEWHPATDLNPNRAGGTAELNYSSTGLRLNWTENPLDHRTTYGYGGVNEYPWQITNITRPAAGLQSEYRYDNFGRLNMVIGIEATLAYPSLTHVYNIPANGPIEITEAVNPGLDESVSTETVTTYDGLGRAIEKRAQGPLLPAPPYSTELVTVFQYDGLGRIICESEPVSVSPGAAAPVCDAPSTPHTTTVYDNAGRISQIILPDGTATTTTYAAPGMSSWVGHPVIGGVAQTRIENAAGGVTYNTQDDTGRLSWIGQMDSDTACSNGRVFISRYDYDDISNLTFVERGAELCGNNYSDSDVITTTITYDGLGRKVAMTDPDMGQWSYDYDPASNLIKQRGGIGTPDAVTTCADYDRLSRMTDQWQESGSSCGSVPGPGNARFLAHYDYVTDTNSPGLGQLDRAEWDPHITGLDGLFADVYTYDSLGRPASQRRYLNDAAFVKTVLAYDRLNRPLAVKYPDGEEITTTYEYWGASTLSAGDTDLVTNIAYNDRGQMTYLYRGNGVGTTYNYLGAAGNFRLDNSVVTGPAGELIDFEYTYDDIGQIETWVTTIANNPTPHERAYEYDKIGRLTQVTDTAVNHSWAYIYDNLGNRTQTVGLSPLNTLITYARAANHPQAVGQMIDNQGGGNIYTSDFGYNALGQMIYREDAELGVTYEQAFDVLGRMVSVAKTEGTNVTTTQFAYDTDGVRVLTWQDDGTIIYDPFPNYEEELQPEEWSDVTVPDMDVTMPENQGWMLATNDESGWATETLAVSNAWTTASDSDFPGSSTYTGPGVGTVSGINSDDSIGLSALALNNLASGELESNEISLANGVTEYTLEFAFNGEFSGVTNFSKVAVLALPDGDAESAITIWEIPSEQSGSWQAVAANFTVPEGTTYLNLMLAASQINGWAAFDDLALFAEGKTLVYDSGFEEIGGWSERPNADFPATSIWRGSEGPALAYEGQFSYVISNLSHTTLTSPGVELVGNTLTANIWVSGWLLDSLSPTDVTFKALYFDSEGRYLSGQDAVLWQTNTLLKSAGWQQVGGSVSPPVGAASVELQIESTYANGSIALDDAYLNSADSCPTINCPSETYTWDFETAGQWSSSSQLDFPASTVWYDRVGLPENELDVASYGFLLSNEARGVVQSSQFSVIGGEIYQVDVSSRGNYFVTGSNSHLLATFLDSNNEVINQTAILTLGSSAFEQLGWAQNSKLLTAPANATQLRIELNVTHFSGWFAFDNVNLGKISQPIPATDGQLYDLSALVSGDVSQAGGYNAGRLTAYFYNNSDVQTASFSTWGSPAYAEPTPILQGGQFTTPSSTASLRVAYMVSIDNDAEDNGWLAVEQVSLTAYSDPISVVNGRTYGLWAYVQGELDGQASDDNATLAVYEANTLAHLTTTWQTVSYNNPQNWESHGGDFTPAVGVSSVRFGLQVNIDKGWLAFNKPAFEAISSYIPVSGDQTYDLTAMIAGELSAPPGEYGGLLVATFYDENQQPIGSGAALWQPNSYDEPVPVAQGGQFTTPTDAAFLKIWLLGQITYGWLDFSDITLREQIQSESTVVRSTYNLSVLPVAVSNETYLLTDTFEEGAAAGWTAPSGNWSVVESSGNYSYRQNNTSGTHYSNQPVQQAEKATYEWTVKFSSGERKAGLHLFGSAADHANHGDSYLIWQHGDSLRIYEYANNTSALRATVSLGTSNNQTYTYRTTYDPTTGQIDVWRNGNLVLSWTDTTPIVAGSYVGLRTSNSNVNFDNVFVGLSDESSLYYMHTDHLGSARAMTDKTGALLPDSVTFFEPFGEYEGTAPTTNPSVTDRGFTGHQHNDDLGLIYMNARYYVPGIGRFASPDTIVPDPGNPQSFNRYSYVQNNPIVYTDPSGHCIFGVDTAICIAVGIGLLKAIDYGWSAWDMWQAGRTLGNPDASRGDKLMAALNVGMTILFEVIEPDDLLPISLPLDDIARRLFLKGAGEALEEGGEGALRSFIRDQLGDHADEALNKVDEILAEYGDEAVGCAFNSFSAGTMVMTEDGPIPIEEIEVGDKVLAYNEDTGEIGYYPVTDLISHVDMEVVYLTIEGETLVTTADHPFYTEEGVWLEADDLQIGDDIRTAAWTTGDVESIAFVAQPQPMYNFTVATAHTYFVGAGQWLVHNCNLNYTSQIHEGTEQWVRFAQVNGQQYRFNTGHGFYRTHKGPGGIITDLRTTTLTPDFIESSIVDDLLTFGSGGGTIPGSSVLERTIILDNLDITYRAITLSDGTVSISTYFISP